MHAEYQRSTWSQHIKNCSYWKIQIGKEIAFDRLCLPYGLREDSLVIILAFHIGKFWNQENQHTDIMKKSLHPVKIQNYEHWSQ